MGKQRERETPERCGDEAEGQTDTSLPRTDAPVTWKDVRDAEKLVEKHGWEQYRERPRKRG